MKVNLHYYSERGLVNTLINWIKDNCDNTEELNKFFDLLGVKLTDDSNIDIYDEISFGQFGDPDLIIKVDNIIFIIEAKIDTFVKSATLPDYKLVFKDNASKINIQLLLRKRFVNALIGRNNNQDNVIKEGSHDSNDSDINKKDCIYKNGRALKKKELVSFINNIFKDYKKIYYVALVSEDENHSLNYIYDNYFKDTNYGFDINEFKILTWEQIDEKIWYKVLFDTWKCTNDKYYRERLEKYETKQ